jgi:dsRNA-specific ribonuclease
MPSFKEVIKRRNKMSEESLSDLGPDLVTAGFVGKLMSDMKLSELGDYLRHWKQVKHEAEEEKQAAERKIEAAEAAIYEKTKAQDLERFTHGGYNFKPKVESYPRVNKENEWEFNGWMYERNFRLPIHPPSLRGWHNHHSEQYAEELVEKNYLSVFEKITISVTKAGK